MEKNKKETAGVILRTIESVIFFIAIILLFAGGGFAIKCF